MADWYFINGVIRGQNPLPPSAALPLCKGENVMSPLQRGTAAKRQGVAHTRPSGVPKGRPMKNMNRREFMGAAFAAAALPQALSLPSRPNVLFILADDL